MIASDRVPLTVLLGLRLKSVAKGLALILFGLALGWLLLEAFLRVGFEMLPAKIQGDLQSVQRVPWSDERIIPRIPWVIDRDFQLRLPPGMQDFPVHWSDAEFTFSTISAWDGHRAGFRSDPPRWPLDVLTFGDSFTFCWTKLEDCWVHRLETDYDWHVFNAAIPGTGTTAQLNLMKEIAPPFKPKVVIWVWFGNDVTDDYDLGRIRGEAPELQRFPEPDPPPEPQGLARYSGVYRLLSLQFNPPHKSPPYQQYQYVTINGRGMLVNTNEYPNSSSLVWPTNTWGWQHNVQSHAEGAQLIQSLGARMLLIAIPDKDEAYSAYLTPILGQQYIDKIGEARRMLLQQCADHGWDCLDPLPAFQAAIQKGQTIYYAFDSHLDPSGNRLLEDLVHSYIVKNGLLPNSQ